MRPSEYQPQFSDADLLQARDLVRRATSRQDYARRARLALLLAEHPDLSNPEAGRRIGVHENTVRYWRKEGCQGGFRVEIRAGRGRKPRFSPLEDIGPMSSLSDRTDPRHGSGNRL